MTWPFHARAPRLAVLALGLVTLTGCPQLNWWSGPSGNDALFSVDPAPHVVDPVEEGAATDVAALPEEEYAATRSPGWRPAR